MNHTPPPWAVVDHEIFTADSKKVVVNEFRPAYKEDLEHIVRCVNLHDELVAALRDCATASTLYDLDRAHAYAREVIAKVDGK